MKHRNTLLATMSLNYQLVKRYQTLLFAAGLCLISLTGPVGSAIANEFDSNRSTAGQPNVLWITSEDNGPHMGCYGDEYADTPRLDELATQGTIYLHCWSNAPVCAPARTTLISGIYPPSLGAEHMRSLLSMPKEFHMYPYYLKQAGYYCTNNSKEDYNLHKVGEVWDDSSRKAHWRNRKEGQPFFAIFNFTVSHESQIRKRPHEPVHDPSKVRVPAYHPDTPEVRRDWAQYYDKITEMDRMAGKVLDELEEDGLTDDTIIFYYGDHGSGMPRSKRWPYNSGLQVPLIVRIPDKFKELRSPDYVEGGTTDRLVSFVDFAPTLLSLCGIEPPEHFQGHAFAGEFQTEQQDYMFGFRGRMDERYDLVRTVADKNLVYLRHYMPNRIYGQFIDYMFQTPTTQQWHDLYHAGKLEPPMTYFWETKPTEELYDLRNDPDEVHNLANDPEYQDDLKRLRQAQIDWILRIRDVGFLPEAEIHSRAEANNMTPYEYGHSDEYPLEDILRAARQSSRPSKDRVSRMLTCLENEDSAVQYWGVMGLINEGEQAIRENQSVLKDKMDHGSPSVAIMSAYAIASTVDDRDAKLPALELMADYANIEEHGLYLSLLSMSHLDDLGSKASPIRSKIEELPKKSDAVPSRMGSYVGDLINHFLANVE